MLLSIISGSLCENKMSGFLEKDNIQNCSSIYQSCLRKEKQYFLKQVRFVKIHSNVSNNNNNAYFQESEKTF